MQSCTVTPSRLQQLRSVCPYKLHRRSCIRVFSQPILPFSGGVLGCMTLTLDIDASVSSAAKGRNKLRVSSEGNHHETQEENYGTDGLFELMRSRTGWLIVFCIGLLLAALVVEEFEDVLQKHVELSIFVPLIMGHGGNTGSQTVTTVVRALALKQVTHRDLVRVVLKEAGAGCLMGALLGLLILAFAAAWDGVSTEVGIVVAIALPLVSLWANGLGAACTLLAVRFKMDPAITSVPLMTTIVDSTGLVVYFYLANWVLGLDVVQRLHLH